jgi:hypothetical protein
MWRFGTAAVAIAALISVAAHGAEPKSPKERAMDWAVNERAAVFDALMPSVRPSALGPADMAISLRSAGFEDTFEFSITLSASRDGTVTGELLLPEKEPLSIQLARLRLRGCKSGHDCIQRIKMRRVRLEGPLARRLMDQFMGLSIPARPQAGLQNAFRGYELTSAGWSELHATFAASDSEDDPFRMVTATVHHVLSEVGLTESNLRFDFHSYYDEK